MPAVPLPVDRVEQASGWADETSCLECHADKQDFWQTGHARTLRPASAASSLSLLRKFDQAAPASARELHLLTKDDLIQAIDMSSGTPRELTLDWCFGSGRHAATWVGTLPDSWGTTDLVEFRWTWYPSIDGFEITPGQPAAPDTGYFGHLGVLYDDAKARRCFACHSSYLPVQAGHIDEAGIRPGVTCQRCHGPQQRHVDSGGTYISESLPKLDQLESINRCAQCHRRPDEQKPEDISPDNPAIVRFAPVGLLQSRCFQNSPQMTCRTCHDPHRPLEAQDSAGIWQCLQCHDGLRPEHPGCRAGHREDCLSCHMPKVREHAPVLFTDHWIRIRGEARTSP